MTLGDRTVYRRIARNSVVLASGTAVSSLFMMLSVAIAARALGAREFGVLVLLQNSMLMVRALTTFSTQQPVIKLGSDAQSKNDKHGLGEIISMGIAVDLAASLVALAVAAIGIEFSRSALGLADQDVGSAWILTVSLLFTGYLTSNGIFRLYDRFGLLSLIQTLSAVGLLGAYAGLYWVGAGLQAFVWAWAAYFAASSLIQLSVGLALVVRDGVPLRFRSRVFATADGRTFLHYCWSTWGTSTAETIRTNGDSLMVGAIISVEAAGLYNVAKQLAGMLRKFNVVYTSTVFPEIAKLAARADHKAARAVKSKLLSVSTFIGVAVVAAVALLGSFVVQILFGPRFEAAYWPFVILTAAAVAQVIAQVSSMYVQVYVGPKPLLRLHIAATLAFVLAAILLTPLASISGMAAAQLLFGAVLLLLCQASLRRTPLSLRG
jgi:O-antigen/teichoic acid export membrane protein